MNHSWITRGILAAGCFLSAAPAAAQTDYFNTDSGRPLTIEDAYPTERYAFELQLAPLRLERSRGGLYRWSVEPEIAYGILPRTHVEVGAPVSYTDAGSKRAGLAGIEIAMLHNLNTETRIPAFAVAGDVLLPVGPNAPEEALFSAKAIATKSFRFARFHLNAQYTFDQSDDLEVVEDELHASPHEASRWIAGLAMDKAFPLNSTLIATEVFAVQPGASGEEVEWNVAAGARKQLSPAFNMDAGIGKQLTGSDNGWFVTLGLSRIFAVRGLLPGF